MDEMKFDAVARGMANGASRRRMLGGSLGAILTVFAGATASAAKKKRKRGDDKEDSGEVDGSSALVGGIWDNTIDVCQFDAEGGYKIVAVPMPSVPDYLDKGGYVYIDCCIDTDCGFRQCAAPSGCIEGACMYDVLNGTECNAGNGAPGVCNQKGECEALPPPPEPVVTTGPVVTTIDDSFPAG